MPYQAAKRSTLSARANLQPILIFLGRQESSCMQELTLGVASVARRLNWSLVFPPSEMPIQTVLAKSTPRAALVHRRAIENEPTAVLDGVPTVWLEVDRVDAPRVLLDEASIGRAAAEHLLSKGFRHFATVNYARTDWTAERMKAFRDALQAKHVTSHTERTFDFANTNETQAVQRWLKNLPKPVGIFCLCDEWARGTIEHCRYAGIAVPEQVAVIGADNNNLVCQITVPPISSVTIPWHKMGVDAAILLEKLLCGEANEQLRVAHATGVTERKSTEAQDPQVTRLLTLMNEKATVLQGIEDLVEQTSWSRRQIERRLRKATGRSPLDEIHRIRIERARALLRDTTLSVEKIATRCGFNSPDCFVTAFRRWAGTSPSAYRRQHGEGTTASAKSD